jgi:hypothetical protein
MGAGSQVHSERLFECRGIQAVEIAPDAEHWDVAEQFLHDLHEPTSLPGTTVFLHVQYMRAESNVHGAGMGLSRTSRHEGRTHPCPIR